MSTENTNTEENINNTNQIDDVPGQVPDSWLWIRDTRGYGSVTVTFLTIAFAVVTLSYLLSMINSIGDITFRPFDVAACSTYFTPLLALYFGRKFTEAKYKS